MSQQITAQEGPYISLEEAVAGALTGKDDLLLSLNNVGKAVLYTGAAPAVAVMIGKNSPDDTVVRARLLGKGGTVRIIQSAAIVPGSLVKAVSASARVATADAGSMGLGYKLSPATNGAAGDVIEVIDLPERTSTPTVVAAPAAAAPADGVFAALNSTAVNPTKADFDALLAQLEIMNDSNIAQVAKLTAMHAALVAAGILIAA